MFYLTEWETEYGVKANGESYALRFHRLETEKFIYLFGLKRDELADKVLQQIEDKSYALPFVADQRKLYKIGVSFNSKQRILSDWKVKEEK